MYFARSGSPGRSTASAYSPGSARMWIGMARDSTRCESALMRTPIEPSHQQVLDFCARDPVERVFLEDVARRGLGRFYAVVGDDGSPPPPCPSGRTLVPPGTSSGRFP